MINCIAIFKRWIVIGVIVTFASCMPNHSYETSKRSDCLFLSTKTFEIVQNCNEGDYHTFTSLEVSVKYDTIKMVNGKASDNFIVFKSNGPVSLPYQLNDSVIKNLGKKMTISLQTDRIALSYALRIDSIPQKDMLPFTFYYNR